MRARKYASLWPASLWAGVCVLVFTVLVVGILGLQQRILALTNETRDVLVPKFLEQIRAVAEGALANPSPDVRTRAQRILDQMDELDRMDRESRQLGRAR